MVKTIINSQIEYFRYNAISTLLAIPCKLCKKKNIHNIHNHKCVQKYKPGQWIPFDSKTKELKKKEHNNNIIELMKLADKMPDNLVVYERDELLKPFYHNDFSNQSLQQLNDREKPKPAYKNDYNYS